MHRQVAPQYLLILNTLPCSVHIFQELSRKIFYSILFAWNNYHGKLRSQRPRSNASNGRENNRGSNTRYAATLLMKFTCQLVFVIE